MLRNESKLRKNADQNPTEIGQNETETDIQAGKKVEKLFRFVKLNKNWSKWVRIGMKLHRIEHWSKLNR